MLLYDVTMLGSGKVQTYFPFLGKYQSRLEGCVVRYTVLAFVWEGVEEDGQWESEILHLCCVPF